MHYLHKILVHIPDIGVEGNVSGDDIRIYAENQTENYYGTAFDWRETGSAGRWSDEYPENVIRAENNIDRFLGEIEEAKESQDRTVNMFLDAMSDEIRNMKIGEIFSRKSVNMMDCFGLLFVARILAGEYYADSYFYDTHQLTAKILDHTLEDIKAHPENWAMCFFDYHN